MQIFIQIFMRIFMQILFDIDKNVAFQSPNLPACCHCLFNFVNTTHSPLHVFLHIPIYSLYISLLMSFLSRSLPFLRRIAIDEERLVLAFGTLDVESKGFLDAEAIRRAMGSGISDVEVADMIAEVDVECSGRINYIDFIKFWRTFIISQNVTPLEKFIRVSC